MKSKQSYILNRSIQAMLIAAMFLFIAAVFGHMNANAAAGGVVRSGNYKGLDWKIVEKADGTHELQLGKAGDPQTFTNEDSKEPTEGYASWINANGEIDKRIPRGTGANYTVSTVEENENTDAELIRIRSQYPWLQGNRADNITSINVLGDIKIVGSMELMFSELPKVSSAINLNSIDTSDVTNMGSLFGRLNLKNDGTAPGNDTKLKEIDISSWDTSNVLWMNSMFRYCGGLTSLKQNFNTRYVLWLDSMFQQCSGLTSLNLSNFNTKNTQNMGWMFADCSNLENIDFGTNFKTGKVHSMRRMFARCSKLTSMDLSGWDMSKVEDVSWMFKNCEGLTSIGGLETINTGEIRTFDNFLAGTALTGNLDLSAWDTKNAIRINGVLGKTKLSSVDISGWDTSNVENMAWAFGDNPNLTSITGLGELNTGSVTNMGQMFCKCPGLTQLDLSGWDTSNVDNMGSMFQNCSSLSSLILGEGWDTSNVKNMANMFYGCTSLDVAGLMDGFDTGSLTDMAGFFSGWEQADILAYLPKLGDTGNVTNMSNLFRGCKDLESANLETVLKALNTSNVTDMSYMFDGCAALTSIDFGAAGISFDTSKVTTMRAMFNGCSGLTSLALGDKFDTSKVTTMQDMFNGCSGLTSLALGDNFDTSKVTTMQNMFRDCSSLTRIDVSGFNTSSVTNMAQMFRNCLALEELDLVNFDTSKVTHTQNMFRRCDNLKSTDMLGFELDSVGTDEKGEGTADEMLNGYLRLANNLKNITIPAVEANTSDYVTGTKNKLGDARTKLEALKYANPQLSGDDLIAALKEISNDYVWKTAQDNVRNAAKAIAAAKPLEDAAQDARDQADRTGDAADIKAAQAAARKADSAVRYAVNQKALAERNIARARQTDTSNELPDDIEKEIDPNNDLEDIVNDQENRNEREEAEAEAQKAADAAQGVVATAAEKTKVAKADAEKVKDGATNKDLTDAKKALSSVQREIDKLNEQKTLLTEKLEKAKPDSNEERILQNALDAVNNQMKITGSAVSDIDVIVKKLDVVVKAITGADKAAADAATAITQAKADADKVKDGTTQADADAAKGALRAVQDVIPALEAAKNEVNAQLQANPSATQRTELEKAFGKVDAEIAKANQAITDITATISGIEGRIDVFDAADKALEAADKAMENAAAAKTASDAAQKKAEEEVNKVASTDAALAAAQEFVKAANEYAAAAEAAKKAADDAVTAAEATNDQTKIEAAKATQTAAAKHVEDAKTAQTAAEALLKKVEEARQSRFGMEITVAKSIYVITKDPTATEDGTATLKTAKNAKNVTVPKTVLYEGKIYEVNRVGAKAFAGKKIRKVTIGANVAKLDAKAFNKSKATTVFLKTKDLTKKSVKGSLKGSKVKTVQVKVGSKKVNKKFVKKYKKIFTKKNAGKKVTVK